MISSCRYHRRVKTHARRKLYSTLPNRQNGQEGSPNWSTDRTACGIVIPADWTSDRLVEDPEDASCETCHRFKRAVPIEQTGLVPWRAPRISPTQNRDPIQVRIELTRRELALLFCLVVIVAWLSILTWFALSLKETS